ncbi:M24 family metallopeptidase [Sphaerisporangium corydalis]|uniref:M24 family metallopeptidase n=1 Tax=Sphaerisporangium corydalis TaxID=1441875 RepID=A0ABV9EC07_9ACTN|nr:M24 family metallopeptidase [Sphaerisporangium corydalis]
MTGEVVAAVLARMSEAGVDALVLRPSADLRYVAGRAASGFLVLGPGLPPGFAADAGEAAKLIPASVSRVGVDAQMRAHELFALRVDADLVLASEVLDPLRARKRPEEIAAIERAAAMADRVLASARGLSWFGATEHDMAARLVAAADAGPVPALYGDPAGRGDLVTVVVAAGENTAKARHEPSGRVINPGDAVSIRVTARHDGYHAHADRGFVVAEPPEDFDALYAVLLSARDAAADAVRPGATAAEVDAAAWTVLDDSGYGAYVTRGTGHGVGLDDREGPWLTPGDRTVLAPGMAIAIEPGVHVPDLYGAWVGDVVECTPTGARPISQVSRALHVLDP